MISRLSLLLFLGIILAHLGDAQKLPKVKKLNMKAHINITGDTLVMKFHRPNQNIKLEGFILGYGSNYFSNQYIQWPDNGKSYITDVDAETRYLIAVKPNDNPKKSCKEKNSIQKPLQLVIGTLTPTSVFLSWGILINPQVDWSVLNKCPNDRFYTVRYREKNKDWNFQLCPTTETVIDNLKPNTIYEFGVKDNSEDEIWGKSQTHKTNPKGKENGNIENTYKIPKGILQYATEDTKTFIPVTKVKQGYQNLTKSTSASAPTGKSPASRITETPPVFKPSEKPAVEDPKPAPYRLHHSSSRPKTSLRPRTRPPAHNGTTQGPIRSRPTGEFNWLPGTIPGGRVYDSTKLLGVSRNISMEPNNTGKRIFSVSSPPLPPVRPTSIRRRIQHSNVTGRPGVSVSSPPHQPVRPTSIRRKPPATNVTSKAENQGGILIPRAPSAVKPECAFVCIKSPTKQPTLPTQEEDLVFSTVFSPSPKSDIDALGKPRYTAPHVVYMSKNDSVPCSITETLEHFSKEEESTNQDITSAPQNPPANLTVVTVEGCSSFVVLNWEKPDNDSVTEYNVISKENGGLPGKDQSIITTNQTHSTVENLKPDTSYEFQVIAKNPLGEGPGSATVEFNTESADPRVSEPIAGGKDAIWTEIKFKSDSYSDCKGKQFVKRTWYKKFVGIQLCNSLRYKIYLSDTLSGTFYNIGDQSGFGEDHCQFVDSFLEGRTGQQIHANELDPKKGFYRSVRQQPVDFGDIGGQTHISYVHWYECGISIPGKW